MDTIKYVSYFYPSSTNAKRFMLPKGGYGVVLCRLNTGTNLKPVTMTVRGFATRPEAIGYANALGIKWASFSDHATA